MLLVTMKVTQAADTIACLSVTTICLDFLVESLTSLEMQNDYDVLEIRQPKINRLGQLSRCMAAKRSMKPRLHTTNVKLCS